MKHRTALLPLIATILALVACTTSPTGRTQLTLIPDAMISQFGVTAFNDIRRSTAEVSDGFVSAYVNCVADAILRELPDDARQRDWQVVVFADRSANAFAVPGGRIGVHEGLLRVAEDQHQLATVVGHEIAHVLARHANERMSTTLIAQSGLQALDKAMSNSSSRREIITVLGLGAQYGALLPYNRIREAEADVMGLEFMARAGFDPRASVVLWQNMAQDSGGQSRPEFMSTHPSHNTRIDGLGHRIPDAVAIRDAAIASGRQPDCDRLRSDF
ncbi:MAG: M48 family metallopeptidase [Gammaproteobacteria bacterium]